MPSAQLFLSSSSSGSGTAHIAWSGSVHFGLCCISWSLDSGHCSCLTAPIRLRLCLGTWVHIPHILDFPFLRRKRTLPALSMAESCFFKPRAWNKWLLSTLEWAWNAWFVVEVRFLSSTTWLISRSFQLLTASLVDMLRFLSSKRFSCV